MVKASRAFVRGWSRRPGRSGQGRPLRAPTGLSSASSISHEGQVVTRGSSRAAPFRRPLLRSPLGEPSGGERKDDPGQTPHRGPPSPARTSMVRFPKSNCAISADFRPNPIKHPLLRQEASVSNLRETSVEIANVDVANPKTERAEFMCCGNSPLGIARAIIFTGQILAKTLRRKVEPVKERSPAKICPELCRFGDVV